MKKGIGLRSTDSVHGSACRCAVNTESNSPLSSGRPIRKTRDPIEAETGGWKNRESLQAE